MARVVITTAGTTGDLVPFVALGKGLRRQGHHVVMAVNPAMAPTAERAGLEAVPCGRRFGADEARAESEMFDEAAADRAPPAGGAPTRADLRQTFLELRDATRGADLLVSSSLQGVAGWVHEATGVPWVNATIFPMEFLAPRDPATTGSVPERAYWRALFDHRNEVRRDLGLLPVDDDGWRDRYWSDRLVLVATSLHFDRPALDERPQARVTGFWFDEPDATPRDPALEAFLDAGDPPLVLTLSSLPVADPGRVAALHAEAALRLNARLVIQSGWAGFAREQLPADSPARGAAVHFTGRVDHSWLFPRCAGVIHHGGIGTTAQALRCGRPALVEPYCNDQFYNAARVAELGAGAAVDHRALDPDTLAAALRAFVLDPAPRRRAEAVGAQLAAENGLAVACALIEEQLAR
jgi:UDP:flavonoid glycosyltransferase YjiC (YdhE family)